ncbi:Negative elongation factor B [Halotydeus destructor]|nr:Negative elongation factor B [Halotydeus destructor]
MEGLEQAGIPGRTFLREALTNCNDPLAAIEDFQNENGILLPSLIPMLPLLDLHDVRRVDFHTSVLDELQDKLMGRIDALGKTDGLTEKQKKENEKRLKDLLQKSFPVLKTRIQPVIMTILKNLDHVDDKYLKQIVADRALYDKCDVVVKRQIWQEHQGLFGDEVTPLLNQYVQEKESMLLNHVEVTATFFSLSPRQRRQNEIIQKLVQMVGKNVLLYDTVVQFLRTHYLRTRNVHYCTLRVELLMALHDAEVQEITTMDPCHKFAWCLDACIREQNVDPKRSRELQAALEGIKKGKDQVLGDLSMVLSDPYAINFLAVTCMKIFNLLIGQDSLPREHATLTLALRLLNLGLHSWDILDCQMEKEPFFDPNLMLQFIPTLMSLMVDDQVRSVNSRLPPDDRESALAIIEHSGPVADIYQHFISNDRLATVLAVYYTFQVARQRDKLGIMRVLGTLANSNENKALENPFMHKLVSLFIPLNEEFTAEDYCTVVFDEFFLAVINHAEVAFHLMKLVLHVVNHLPVHRLEVLAKTISSLSLKGEKSQSLLLLVNEKIGERQAATDDQDTGKADEDLPIPMAH